jgi:hypothetical protein
MTRRPRRAALAALIAVTTAIPGANSGQKKVVPASVDLAVRWSGAAGSDAFRDDLRHALAEDLATSCFAAVTIPESADAPGEPGLILDVVLSDAREETEFDDAIADTLQAGDPSHELRRVIRCAVTIDFSLAVRAKGEVLVRKHFSASVARRPMYVGEDPQAAARADVIKNVTRQVSSSLGCGGAKLERKIRDALADGGPGAPRAR